MESVLSNDDRLNLQQMINANDVEDQTPIIREKKHSDKIKEQVTTMITLKKNYNSIVRIHFFRVVISHILYFIV